MAKRNMKVYLVSNFRFHFILVTVHLLSQRTSCTPTVFGEKDFNVQEDVKNLHHIGRGEANYVQDDTAIAEIICHRSREQRIAIKEEWNKTKNLQSDDILSHLSSASLEISYDQLVEYCFTPEMEIYLRDIHEEFENAWTDTEENTIVEILLSIPPLEKKKFAEMYANAYDKPIEDAATNYLKDDIKNVILEMIARERQPEIPVDIELAKTEAQKLNDEIDKWKDHRKDLDRIVIETPLQQLNAILTEFRNIHGRELEDVISDKMKKKHKKRAYLAMIHFAKNPADYYARRLEHAFSGWGTDDTTLNRIISIHSERDMVEIKTAFQLNTADDLINAIKSDTTLHHEQLLACLAGEQDTQEHC